MASFEELTAELGWRPLRTSPPGWQNEISKSLAYFNHLIGDRALYTKPGHQVAVGYLEDMSWNARATTIDGNDVIAIFFGLLRDSYLISRAIADRGVDLPWANLDSPELKREMGHFLHQAMVTFVFLHEQGHIWSGHTDFWGAKYGSRTIDELRGDPAALLDRQTIEMNADGYAASNTVSTALHHFHTYSPRWLSAEFDSKYCAGASMVATALFAVYLSFRGWDQAWRLEGMEQRFYPASPMRMSMILNASLEALRMRGLQTERGVDLVTEVMKAGERAHAAITGEPENPSVIIQTFSTEGIIYLRKLLRHWAVLRPELDKLKRGGNLPPVEDSSEWQPLPGE